MHPESANPYDSLAEAYVTRGDRGLAIVSYRKPLTLNAKNPNAVAKPEELRGGEKREAREGKPASKRICEYARVVRVTLPHRG